MTQEDIQDLQARLDAQEIILEILCAQLWATLSPQKMELVGQRYMRMLHQSLSQEDDNARWDTARDHARKILNNALVRAPALRSTI